MSEAMSEARILVTSRARLRRIGGNMPHDVAAGSHAADDRAAPASRDQILLVAIALTGALVIGLGGQSVGFNIGDVQGGIGASADEGSMLTTAYTMAQLGGIVCAVPFISAFGLGRYIAASALLFAVTALACGAGAAFPEMMVLRMVQGFAAAGFGPAAFVAVIRMMRGSPGLPLGLALLTLALLLPVTLGRVASPVLTDHLGWKSLFLVQALASAAVAVAAIVFIPRAPVTQSALRVDWTAMFLLSLALAATILVLGQGTRRYWLDSPIIIWSLATGAGAWAGFLITEWQSPCPVLNLALLTKRCFVAPIALNLFFSVGLAGTSFLIPQFLAIVQAYRPLEIGQLYLWAIIAQLLMCPVAVRLLRLADGRLLIACGLLLFGLGMALVANSTSLVGAAQMRIALILAGTGQSLFLIPLLLAAVRSVMPSDGPTISVLFNISSVGGTSIGTAIASEFVSERLNFHLGALAESAVAFGPKLEGIRDLGRVVKLGRGVDTVANAQTFATIAGALRRQAFVLTFNDAMLILGGFLIASAIGIVFLDRQPPFRCAAANRGSGAAE